MNARFRFSAVCSLAMTLVTSAQVIVDDAGTARDGKVGYWSSLVAQNGDVAISYYCETDLNNSPPSSYTLRFAWATGNSWQWTTVDYNAGSDTSMARGSDGQYRVAYTSWTGMGWAVGEGTNWNVSSVGIPASVAPSNISMVLDTADNAHIAYMDFTGNRALHYIHYDGTQWLDSIVGQYLWTPTIGFSNTYLKLDAAGTPHIAYAQPSDGTNAFGPMKYATLSGGTWQSDGLGVDGVDPSLAIGSDNIPRIAFNGTGGLTYAYKSGGTWHFETVVAGQRGSSVSMTLDSQNNPVLSFGMTANEDMYVARRDATGWIVDRIDGDGTNGPHVILGRYGTAVDVDEADNVHVSYLAIDIYSLTHRCDLKYWGPGGGSAPCVTITGSPSPVAACAGDSAGFSVVASSADPMTFGWRKDGVALVDGPTASGSIVSGASTPDLMIDNVGSADEGLYSCLVSATCGDATSGAAALTLNAPAAVTSSPAPVNACLGSMASFSVTASGTGLSYQWYRSASPLSDGPTGTGSTLSGAHSATLSVDAVGTDDVGDYFCSVSNACGSDDSAPAALTVATCGNPCDADLNEDGFVDLEDLAILLGHYGDSGGVARDDGDIDGDDDIDLTDLAILLSAFGSTC